VRERASESVSQSVINSQQNNISNKIKSIKTYSIGTSKFVSFPFKLLRKSISAIFYAFNFNHLVIEKKYKKNRF